MIQDGDRFEKRDDLQLAGRGDASNTEQSNRPSQSRPQELMERSTLLIGAIWCLIGGFAMPVTHVLSIFMVGYGSTLLLKSRDSRRLPITLVLTVIPAVLRVQSLQMSRDIMLSSMISIAIGISIGYMMARLNMSLNKELALIALAAVFMLGIDVLLSSAEGKTLGETILTQFDEAARNLTSQNIALKLEVQALREQVELMWPMMYVLNAFISVMAAHVGAKLASNKLALKNNTASMATFSLPLWMIVIPVLALMCLGLATSQLTAWSDQLFFVGLNVFNAVRIPLSFQALGLVLSVAKERGVSKVITGLLFFTGIVLELSFYALSVIGLVDLLADFRGIRHAKVSAE